MKRFFTIILFECTFGISVGQSVITKPITSASSLSILDFGAVPNDDKDDTWAFIKAGKYFSNLWNKFGIPLEKGAVNFDYSKFSAALIIPSGNYKVGKQIAIPKNGLKTTYGNIFGYPAATAPLIYPAGSAYLTGLELIVLENPLESIDQFSIVGKGPTRPVIQYNDKMVFGYFDDKGTAKFMDETNYDSKYTVSIGNFIHAMRCKNINIENIEIDGNNTPATAGGTTMYGGSFSEHLIQTGSTGIFLGITKNITIKDVSIHHMTLDGVIFLDYYKDPQFYKYQESSNLLINNIDLNYNRRQGLSWVGGKGVKIINSRFNNTGVGLSGIAAGNPAAGIDIEPEADERGEPLWCVDGTFINCTFLNNKGCGLVNDDIHQRTEKLVFDNCTFHDVDSYAVWVTGKGIQFNNCRIWGGFAYGNAGFVEKDATVFNNCDFADEEIQSRPGEYNKGYALVESWKVAKRMKFNDCTFRSIHQQQRIAAIFTPSVNESEFAFFSNCNFLIGPQSKSENVMFGCTFDKSTKIINQNKSEFSAISMNGIVFTGSTNSKAPYEFSIEGRIMLGVANTNGLESKQFLIGRKGPGTIAKDGYARFVLNSESCLYGYWDQVLEIGPNSTFINKTGGQIALLSGGFKTEGLIILEAGSYTAFFNPVFINASSKQNNSKFYFNTNAKMALSPVWYSKLSNLGKPITMPSVKANKNVKIEIGNKTTIAIKKG